MGNKKGGGKGTGGKRKDLTKKYSARGQYVVDTHTHFQRERETEREGYK